VRLKNIFQNGKNIDIEKTAERLAGRSHLNAVQKMCLTKKKIFERD
jgi:hypothetical protein